MLLHLGEVHTPAPNVAHPAGETCVSASGRGGRLARLSGDPGFDNFPDSGFTDAIQLYFTPHILDYKFGGFCAVTFRRFILWSTVVKKGMQCLYLKTLRAGEEEGNKSFLELDNT